MSKHPRRQEQALQTEPYDVAILGGGIAGLTLALQLKQARPATTILVIEKQQYPVPEAAHKVGESTVEIAAHYLRDLLGLGGHLKNQQLNKFGLRMFFSTDDNLDIARRVELGHATLPPQGVGTYQLDRGRLENALAQELPRQGIALLTSSKVQQLDLRPEETFHQVQVLQEQQRRQIQARWLVDASGRTTLLQRHLGLARSVGHQANAVWFRLGYPIDVNGWSSDPDWRGRILQGDRALSTNHLMGPGYWVWLIRLASGSTSVGIVTDARLHDFSQMNRFERAVAWLEKHEPQCAAEIKQHREQLQDFRVMKDYSYSCEQVYSQERWCLTGEAAVSLDPLYSPGGDLIAISNGLISDLISRSLNGENVEELAAIHNQIFLLVTESWLGIYNQQYPIMGHAQVMVAKVIWDTAVYWAIPGLLYFHDKFRRLSEYPDVVTSLVRFSTLSDHIQPFFHQWNEFASGDASNAFVRYYDFDFMTRLQIGMTAGLPDDEFANQFAANVDFLERLAGQLVLTVIESYADQREDEIIQKQVQCWEADPFLTELIASYRREEVRSPINSGWITLGKTRGAWQEVAR